jgi:hypothetical protein
VHTYFANQRALPRHRADGTVLTPADGGPEVREREDLCAVLVVAARPPSLDADALAMGLTWEDLGGGYLRVHDGLFTLSSSSSTSPARLRATICCIRSATGRCVHSRLAGSGWSW